MESFNLVVRSVSIVLYRKLLRELKNQPRKIQLLKFAFKNRKQEPDYTEFAKTLGYAQASGAFNTLKSRLAHDIIAISQKPETTEPARTYQRISELRKTLTMDDRAVLEKEIKTLKQTCLDLELVRGTYELHLCEFLLYQQNKLKRKTIASAIEKTIELESIYRKLEFNFYSLLLLSQDIYFQGNAGVHGINNELLERIQGYDQILNSAISRFFLLFAEVTVKLRLDLTHQESLSIIKKSEQLKSLWENGNLKEQFPDLFFKIECLFNKLYFLKGSKEELNRSLDLLENYVRNSSKSFIYEDALFYFLFARIHQFTTTEDSKRIIPWLESLIPEKNYGDYSERTRYYLNHFKAIGFLYINDLQKAEMFLLRARSLTAFLEENGFWIQIENIILNLSIQINNKRLENASVELNALKRIVKKPYINRKVILPFITATEKLVADPSFKVQDYTNILCSLKNSSGLLLLLNEKCFS